jgi:serine/threonine protein kinase/tetratricopeptide (TPR) repeat protein
MDPDRFKQIEGLFHAALERERDERPEFLQAACGDDEDLLHRVEQLLEKAEKRDALPDLHAEVVHHDLESEGVGATIDTYHLVERLGEGGFGVVYRAEQTHPIRREVALKVIKLGMDTKQVIARFEAERDSLARMEHPGIARVLDAGVMPSGRPYFVMDLVRGVDVRTWCDGGGLDLRDRVELVARICDAVHHAHQKGVIHRDLKPSNVLVVDEDGRPDPRVIDFGIARATDESVMRQTRFTVSGQLVGTPAYMSPEQAAEPQRADTRTDVYALGAILYELVTGDPPFDEGTIGSASQSEIERILRDVEPTRPSSLSTEARGDLEAIILMAMDKSPDRRYSSVAALGDDLRRFLRHEPVIARVPSWGYRLTKYIRRHRVAATAVAVIAAVVVLAGLAVIHSTLDARRAAEQTAAVNAFMEEILTTAQPDREGADVRLIDVMEAASRDAMVHFEDDPELQAMVKALIGRVYHSLDVEREATEYLQPAYRTLADLFGTDDRRTLNAGRTLATSLTGLYRFDEAENLVASLTEPHRAVFGPDAPESLALEHIRCGLLGQRGQYDKAIRQYRALQQRIRRSLGPDDPLSGEVSVRLAILLCRRWQAESGSDTALLEALEILAPLIPPEGDPAESNGTSVQAMMQSADIYEALERPKEVVQLARRVIALAVPRFGETHGYAIRAMQLLAYALSALGEHDEAADWIVRAIEDAREIRSDRHPSVISAMLESLPILDAGGRDVEGEAYARLVVTQMTSFAGPDHEAVLRSRAAAAHFVSRQGRLDEAGRLFDAAAAIANDDQPADTRAIFAFLYGQHLIRCGEREAALERLRDAERLFAEIGPAPRRQRGVWDADAARAVLADLTPD